MEGGGGGVEEREEPCVQDLWHYQVKYTDGTLADAGKMASMESRNLPPIPTRRRSPLSVFPDERDLSILLAFASI